MKRGLITGAVLLAAWLLYSFWPVRWGLNWPLLRHTHLLVVTNENESRPCGGFATAVGTMRLLPPALDLQNSYAYNADLGESPEPIKAVSERLHLWDVGDTPDLNECTVQIANAARANGLSFGQVILVDIGTVERLAALIGWRSFFADISRGVADIDRHNEAALESRKDGMKPAIKKITRGLMVRPWAWRKTAKLINNQARTGAICLPNVTNFEIPEHGFGVTEWNLGGAKSSRYLQKRLDVFIKQSDVDLWEVEATLDVRHAGGWDEPLSTNWKGRLEVTLPSGETELWDGELAPSEAHRLVAIEKYRGTLNDLLALWAPRGQRYDADVNISLLPQQRSHSRTMGFKEGVLSWRGSVNTGVTELDAVALLDNHKPFMTLHTNVPDVDFWPNANLVIEVHFSEEMKGIAVPQLVDANVLSSVTDIAQKVGQKWVDGRTLLLAYTVENPVFEERWTLTIEGLTDRWGNLLDSEGRTIVHREGFEKN